MKIALTIILVSVIWIGLIWWKVVPILENNKQVISKPESVITQTVIADTPKLEGYHIRGSLWQAKKDDSVELMFGWLLYHDWKFKDYYYEDALHNFMKRLETKYPDLVKDGKFIKDGKIDFSPPKKNDYAPIRSPDKNYKYFKKPKTMLARITEYDPKRKGEMKVNNKGKNIVGTKGLAVPVGTLPHGTLVKIPKYGIYKVDDLIPAVSVAKVRRKSKEDYDIHLDWRGGWDLGIVKVYLLAENN